LSRLEIKLSFDTVVDAVLDDAFVEQPITVVGEVDAKEMAVATELLNRKLKETRFRCGSFR
jgi:hypothetical protein